MNNDTFFYDFLICTKKKFLFFNSKIWKEKWKENNYIYIYKKRILQC